MLSPLLDAIGFVGNVLDTPASVLRGFMAGDPGRAFGGILNPEERVMGRDLLEQYGLAGENQEGLDAGDVGGFLVDAIMDPLSLVPFWGGAKAAARSLKGEPGIGKAIGNFMTDEAGTLTFKDPFWKDPGPQFYSRLEKAAESLPEQMKAESVMNALKKYPEGVSQEEIGLTGLQDYLAGNQGGKVTKSELLRKIQEPAGEIEVKTMVGHNPTQELRLYGEDWPDDSLTVKLWPGNTGKKTAFIAGADGKPEISIVETMVDDWKGTPRKSWVVYDEAAKKELGGDSFSHHEILARAYRIMKERHNLPDATKWHQFSTLPKPNYKEKIFKYTPEEGPGRIAYNQPYISQHWDDQNVMAHMRYGEMPGRLHIDELQSDWHQAGRNLGYSDLDAAMREDLLLENNWLYDEIGDARKRVLSDLYESGMDETNPEAFFPFRKMPMIEEVLNAALKNPDAMDPGTLEMARYVLGKDSGKQLIDLTDQLSSNMRRLSAPPPAPLKDTWHEMAMKSALLEAVQGGKEALTWNPGDVIRSLVGGSEAGQRKFYDEVLPGFMNKLGQKYGVQAEGGGSILNLENFIREGESAASLVSPWRFRITDEMRKDLAEKGLPLMSIPLVAALMGGGEEA